MKIVCSMFYILSLILLCLAITNCSQTLPLNQNYVPVTIATNPKVNTFPDSLNIGAENYSGAFIVVKGSGLEKIIKLGSSRRMTYTVESLYPSSEVISEIKDKLSKAGWVPLKEDFMNPGLPSSYVRGWDIYIDKDHVPATKVHEWKSGWKNDKNEIVRYKLKHEYPVTTDNIMNILNVQAEYYPAFIVEKMTSQTNKNK